VFNFLQSNAYIFANWHARLVSGSRMINCMLTQLHSHRVGIGFSREPSSHCYLRDNSLLQPIVRKKPPKDSKRINSMIESSEALGKQKIA
jgi:hypothetical protein